MATPTGPIDPSTFSTALMMSLLYLIDELKTTQAIDADRYASGLRTLAERMSEHQTDIPDERPFDSLSGLLGMIANHAAKGQK